MKKIPSNPNQHKSRMQRKAYTSRQGDRNVFFNLLIQVWRIAFPFANNFRDQEEQKANIYTFYVLILKLLLIYVPLVVILIPFSASHFACLHPSISPVPANK